MLAQCQHPTLVGAQCAARPALRAHWFTTSRPHLAAQATQAKVAEAGASAGESSQAGGKAEVYIGFEKGDYLPREGRKGRVVIDDIDKYPARSLYTGGWAGGEAGLKQFIADYQREKELNAGNKVQAAPAPADLKPAKPIGAGSDVIYVGHAKDDLLAKRVGSKGRTIRDDARKYPMRNEVTGGFAGGELGLKTYVEIGDVPIAEGGSGRRQPQSPLLIAGVISLAATAGGLLVIDVEDVGEAVLTGAANPVAATTAAVAGMDETTKLLLEVALIAVGAVGTIAGGRALVGSVTNSLKLSATRLATLAVFWAGIFLAVRFVLDY